MVAVRYMEKGQRSSTLGLDGETELAGDQVDEVSIVVVPGSVLGTLHSVVADTYNVAIGILQGGGNSHALEELQAGDAHLEEGDGQVLGLGDDGRLDLGTGDRLTGDLGVEHAHFILRG